MDRAILQQAIERFGLQNDKLTKVETHEGGRNIVYRCQAKAGTRFLRISCMNDRSFEDYRSETDFVHYLAKAGAPVADVLPSVNGVFVESIQTEQGPVFVSLFEEAIGDQLAAHGYQYRERAPLQEYFYNCGKCLGRIHELSKQYHPEHPRYDYSRRFNMNHFTLVTPKPYAPYLPAIERILNQVEQLDKKDDLYGIVHFDFSDGNYMIDYSNGDINVFDFENCCRCWYLYDLANLWIHGVGWIQFEPDAKKRRAFMDWYFSETLKGYRSVTSIEDEMLAHLTLMIQLVLVENILDEFENADNEEEEDGEMLYRLKCLAEDIPYMGFFGDFYSVEHPFSL